MTSDHLTTRQKQWFSKIKEGLESDTGKTLDDWITVAKKCPETTHKARLKWLKEQHGIGLNRASTILNATFETGLGWDNPEKLLDNLWKTPELRNIYNAIEAYAISLSDDVITGPRKSFSGFSRTYQFAAARPVRGKVRLGIAVDPAEYKLEASKSSDSWSDRVTSVVIVTAPEDINKNVKSLIKAAWKAG